MQAIPRRPYLYRHNTALSRQAATGQLQLRPLRRILIPTCRPSRILLCLQTLTGERALIASLWPPRLLHRCASLSPSYHEGAAVCRTGVFPVKIRQAKPLYLTFACPRLLTYRPSSLFPPLYTCACHSSKRHWTRSSARAYIPPASSCRHRNLRALVFLSLHPPTSACITSAKASGLIRIPFFGRRIPGLGLRILQAFSAAALLPLEHNGDVQGSVIRDCDPWC